MNLSNNNNLFKSLEQGLGMLSERKNIIFSLKNKIKHSQDNIIEGFCETGTVDEKISCFKEKHEEKGQSYQTTMMDYSGNYRTFLENLKKAQTDVSNCKLKCYDHPGWNINRETDFGEGDPNVETPAKFKTLAKRACKVGCHLKSPQIMDCEDTFGKVESFPSDLDDIKKGMTCSGIYSEYNFKVDVNKFGDEASSLAQTNLLAILDASGNNAYDHCCLGKLGEKYKPYKLMDNKKYTSCSQFGEAKDDPATVAGVSNAARRTACELGYDDKFKSTTGDYDFKDEYEKVVGKNKTMMKTSNEILDIVQELKDLGETIVQSKKEQTMEFRNDNEKYEKIIENIKRESDPLKVDTLNKYIEDKVMLKQSTDLKIYVWIVLALGFGISALMKIKHL